MTTMANMGASAATADVLIVFGCTSSTIKPMLSREAVRRYRERAEAGPCDGRDVRHKRALYGVPAPRNEKRIRKTDIIPTKIDRRKKCQRYHRNKIASEVVRWLPPAK